MRWFTFYGFRECATVMETDHRGDSYIPLVTQAMRDSLQIWNSKTLFSRISLQHLQLDGIIGHLPHSPPREKSLKHVLEAGSRRNLISARLTRDANKV
jgi:hypothetical protein